MNNKLDTVERQVLLFDRRTATAPHKSGILVQFGMHAGQHVSITYHYVHGRIEDEDKAELTPCTEAEFLAHLAQLESHYDWQRVEAKASGDVTPQPVT